MLFILFMALGVLSQLPLINYPTASTKIPENTCPEHKQAFYLCERQREQCDRESRKATGCGKKHVECIRKILVSTEECRTVAEHKEKQAMLEHPNGILTEERINEQVETEAIRPVDEFYSAIKNNCFGGDDGFNQTVDLLSKRMPVSTKFTKKLLHVLAITRLEVNSETWANCTSSITQLQRALKVLDRNTTMSLNLPYNLWRCGWQTDDFGMVLVRKAAQITSLFDAEKFNHCCAIHMDCYLSQLGRENCDRQLEKCGNKTIDSSVGSSQGIKLFKDILKDLMELTSQEAYKNAGQLKNMEVYFETYGPHESSFDGFRPDPVNKRERYIVYVSLSDDFQKYDRQKFSNVYKECLNNWAAVSSCGHLAQICMEDKSLGPLGCTFQLDECLSQVCPQADECKETFAEIEKNLQYLFSETFVGRLIIAADLLVFFIYLIYVICKTISNVIQQEDHWIRRAWRWMIGVFGRMRTRVMGFFRERAGEQMEMREMARLNRD